MGYKMLNPTLLGALFNLPFPTKYVDLYELSGKLSVVPNS